MEEKSKYKVVISATCRNEIKNICKYIEDSLFAYNASKNLLKKLDKAISNLEEYPEMYKTIKKYRDVNLEYRNIVIDNYIILYTISEESKTVYISHIYYGKSNYWNKI